jgi:hypothetical protein
MEHLDSHSTDFHKTSYLSSFERLSRTFFLLNRTRIRGALPDHQYTFLIISHLFLRRKRNISEKFVDTIEAHILGPMTYFENSSVYEITPKNIVQPDRPRMTIWCKDI